MIEIFKRGDKKAIICKNCGADLRYNEKDTIETGEMVTYTYGCYDEYRGKTKEKKIICPCCGIDIIVS